MRKVIAMIQAVLIIFTLLSCSHPKYRFINGNGYDYAILNVTESENPDCDISTVQGPPGIVANSVDNMLDKLKNGNLSELEFNQLARMETDEKGRIILPDLDNLLEVIPPKEIQWNDIVVYEMGRYIYRYFDEKHFVGATIDSKDNTFYNYQEFIDKCGHAVISKESTDSEADATRKAYHEDNGLGTRTYYFQIQIDAKTFYIAEVFHSFDASTNEHNALPDVTYIYTQISDDLYLRINSSNSEELHSIDWLTSFNVKPYGE